MNAYTLRIDQLEGITRKRIEDFVKLSGFTEHVVVFEISEETRKPHFQGYVLTDVKHAAYQKRVQKAFPECVSTHRGGRGAYSAGVIKDIDAYRRYIMKGTETEVPDVVSTSVQLTLSEAWAESRQAESAKRKHDRTKCDKSKSIVERGREHFKDHQQVWGEYFDVASKHREVCRWVMKEQLAAGKLLNDFLIRQYITSILCSFDEHSFDYTLNRILDKL